MLAPDAPAGVTERRGEIAAAADKVETEDDGDGGRIGDGGGLGIVRDREGVPDGVWVGDVVDMQVDRFS